ncbi:MAG: tyrosinase family protein [Planctomycetaceae bacterium]
MSAINAQTAVASFHADAARGQHGHNMYLFHRDWHQTNRDPTPPTAPNPDWGVDLMFGRNFLQMHHEMVKATDGEAKFFMMHSSLVSWYMQKGYDLPPEWNPLTPIPAGLAYAPDPDVYPQEIRDTIAEAAHQDGTTLQAWLTRTSQNPQFQLPKYFTRDGVSFGESGEPYTGARKLADFKNVNQLGCCMVFPHNTWHGRIGGAMQSTWTAIADPIFYFGVHWNVDRVFDEYKRIQAEWSQHGFDSVALRAAGILPTQKVKIAKKFTKEVLAQRQHDIALSRQLSLPPQAQRKEPRVSPRASKLRSTAKPSSFNAPASSAARRTAGPA